MGEGFALSGIREVEDGLGYLRVSVEQGDSHVLKTLIAIILASVKHAVNILLLALSQWYYSERRQAATVLCLLVTQLGLPVNARCQSSRRYRWSPP